MKPCQAITDITLDILSSLQNCAIYVCIVMDYYKLGDLDQTLRNKRKIKEMLEEAVLRKWVGQMVEALVYVHEKNIIHRSAECHVI